MLSSHLTNKLKLLNITGIDVIQQVKNINFKNLIFNFFIKNSLLKKNLQYNLFVIWRFKI